MLKILIVDGNVKEARDSISAAGMLTQWQLYKNVLETLADDLVCTVVYPADADAPLPTADELAGFDGIVWTGSALNIYDRGPAIDRQIEFMRLCQGEDTRMFGSCWGLQVAVVASGGEVGANIKGREIGIARDIGLTDQGRKHPLYQGKASCFDAVAIHLDHTVQLPEGTKVLAGNDLSQVQAVEITRGKSIFWGVQYHPEFDLEYISALIRRYGETLVKEGFRHDVGGIEKWAQDLSAAQHEDADHDLRQEYALGADVLDPRNRLLELANWLQFLRDGR